MICWELSADTREREDKKKEWEGKGKGRKRDVLHVRSHTNLSIRKSIILQISSILSFFLSFLSDLFICYNFWTTFKTNRSFQVRLCSRSCLKRVTVVPKQVTTAPNRVIVIELVVPRKEVVTEAVEELTEEEEVVVKVVAEQSSSALHSLEHIFYPLLSPLPSLLPLSSSLLIH